MSSTAPDPAMPDERSFEEAWQRAKERAAFWDAHRAAYARQYPEEFVAVTGGEVVAHEPDLRTLLRRLEELGHDLRDVWVEYMRTARNPLLL